MKSRGKTVKSKEETVSKSEAVPKKLLFTTKTCPNCVTAKVSLEEAHIDYETIDAQEEKNLTKKYGILSAPTLIVVKNDGTVDKLVNASNILKYIKEI